MGFGVAGNMAEARQRACRRTGMASSRPFNLWTASGCIAYKTNIGCFAVLARDENCSLSGLNAEFSDTLLDSSAASVADEVHAKRHFSRSHKIMCLTPFFKVA